MDEQIRSEIGGVGQGTRAVVVGHSMGGTVAQRFAVDYPERTLGVVLMASFLLSDFNQALSEFHKAVAVLEDPIDPAFALEFQRETLARPVADEFLSMVVAESLKVPARVWRAALDGMIEEPVAPHLSRVTAPALLVSGERDAFVPTTESEALAAAIPRARLVVYAGAGHAVHWEEPARFAADLSAFAGWR